MRPFRPPRVDAHVHAWSAPDASHVAPMLGARPGAPLQAGGAPALLAALDAASVGSALVVQPACYAFDHSYMLDAARASGGRVRVCASVDPSLPAISAVMAAHALADAGVAALRFNPYLDGWDPDEGLASDTGLATADTAAARGVPVCVMAFKGLAPLAPAINRIMRTVPSVRVVLDHCGFVGASALDGPDARALASLAAAHPDRLTVKASAWFRVAGNADGAPGVDGTAARGLMAWLLDTVGPARLMWGTDWPWAMEHGTYEGAWALLDEWEREGLLSAADAAAVGGGNAATLFGFNDGDA